MNTLTLNLKRLAWGWAGMRSDGAELARFSGPGSRRRALRYIAAGGAIGA